MSTKLSIGRFERGRACNRAPVYLRRRLQAAELSPEGDGRLVIRPKVGTSVSGGSLAMQAEGSRRVTAWHPSCLKEL